MFAHERAHLSHHHHVHQTVTYPAAAANPLLRRLPAAVALSLQHGGIDIVFSNAGTRMTPDRSPESQVDAVVDSYNLGAIRMLRAFAPLCAQA
jgi:NAD(P)-dependent dehydrogenase (short-subunit alcohol dehydrogenase family)